VYPRAGLEAADKKKNIPSLAVSIKLISPHLNRSTFYSVCIVNLKLIHTPKYYLR
jgi:hypothetical protein